MNHNLLKDVILKHTKHLKKVELTKNSIIYEDENKNRFVAKENKNDIVKTYNYLKSRGFDYIPDLVYYDDKGYIYRYASDGNIPKEQKMSDLIKLDALLHNKTVYYKDIALDEVKEIFENLNLKIDDTYNYYDNILDKIENNIYMSPSEYLLARNSNVIFNCLSFCKNELKSWYDIMSLKNKKRVVLLHNNLDVSHIVRSDSDKLLSWNNSVRDLPIYDFIGLYKKNFNNYDFKELYKEYKKRFPLLEEEEKLMFIILFIPYKIYFNDNELKNTMDVGKLCNYLYNTDKLFMEQQTKNTDIQNNNINEQ